MRLVGPLGTAALLLVAVLAGATAGAGLHPRPEPQRRAVAALASPSPTPVTTLPHPSPSPVPRSSSRPSPRPTARYVAPPWRTREAMAADPGTGLLVLYGGEAGSSTLFDTWTWNGSAWRKAAGGPELYYPAMAYDPTLGRLLLVGAGAGGGFQTWAWSASGWSKVRAGGAPPLDQPDPAMAYDAAHGYLLLSLGHVAGDTYYRLLWRFDGRAWKQVSDQSPTLIAAAPGGAVIGLDRAGMRRWSGSAWVTLNVSGTPGYAAAAAFDPLTGRLLVVGNSGPLIPDTGVSTTAWFTWDGGPSWRTAPMPDGWLQRAQFAMAWDGHARAVIAWGGTLVYGFVANTPPPPRYRDTWAFDGRSWRRLAS